MSAALPLFAPQPVRHPSLAWIDRLRADVREIKNTELRDLSADERVTLGRWHAYRFGNCTKDEKRNWTRGSQVASALAGMAASKEFGDFTVDEYLGAAMQFHELRNKIPWFTPWHIRAVVTTDDLQLMRRRRYTP